MTSNIYSKSNIQSSLALAAQGSTIIFDRLLPIITASTDDSQIPKGIDVYDLWNATTMDSITAFQFGLSNATNFLENIGYRRHWLELYQSRKTYTFFPQELPRLTAFMRTIGIRLVPRWVDYANREIEAWCADMCRVATANAGPKESYQNLADEPVVLNSLIAGIKKERKSKGAESVLAETTLAQTELSISSEMLDNLAAGHETSGITLTYLTWHLSQDLTLQEKLRAELLTLDHPMQYPPNSEKIQLPNSKELDNLPLLHAVIMETLRLDAAIPGSQPRMSPFPSSVLGGYEIPGGVRVSAAAYSLHRNMTVFPHADAWDHTRWLDSAETNEPDEDRTKDRDRYFWAFSSGGRMCVGSNFAMHGMNYILPLTFS
jgi:cytochrome P450